MRALSIRAPWAHAIAHLGKRVENRTWATSYRGPVLIHASSTFDRADFDALAEIIDYHVEESACVAGAIIAIADLVDCVDKEDAPSRWTVGPIAWKLRNVRVLSRPITAKGRLGLWTPSRRLLSAVHAAL